MILTERHIIKKSDKNWKQCDDLCFKSKNLYNQALYRIKKGYEDTGHYKRYREIDKEMKLENQFDYRELPNSTSQQTLMLLDKNIKSFFGLLRKWKKNKKSLKGCPKFPKYKHKTKGRNIVIFTYQQFSVKDNMIKFCKKTNLFNLKTKIVDIQKICFHNIIQQIRIVPQANCYIIEIVYKKEINNYDLDKTKYLSIDLGINNLMTVITNNPGLKPFIINGKIVKSTNQYYNKKKAKLQEQLIKNHKKYNSNRINRLIFKRNNKLNDYLHKSSHYIIKYCIENNIGNIVIGYNKEWKQDINIGKVNNQKFTQIPFSQLINQLKYKGELNSINVIEQEESYTSKIDHLALETMEHKDSYLGKRKGRGMFVSSTGKLINADVNGSIGILRKVIGDEFISIIDTGLAYRPLKVRPL